MPEPQTKSSGTRFATGRPPVRAEEGGGREATFAERQERRRTARAASIGFLIEALFDGTALLITTAGMIAIAEPTLAASIAVIAFAAGLLVASKMRRFAAKARVRETGLAEVGAFSAEYLAGGPAVIMGTLAASGIVPDILTAVATLLFGVMLMLGGSETGRQASVSMFFSPPQPPDRNTQRILEWVAGIQMLAGIAAVVLAIMALVGTGPAAPVLISLSVLSATKLLGAGTIAWRMGSMR